MCEWKPDFEQLKEQTEENSRQIAGRALTDAEAAHNYAVDKARFNLT